MARPKNSRQVQPPAVVPDVSASLSFTLKQAAAATGVALWHLRSAIWDGQLSARLIGKKQIVLRSDLERWLTKQPTIRGRAA
jgi:hypothetical protein